MKIKFILTTPTGQAKKTSDRLKLFLLKGKKIESYTNEEDNQVIWIFEGNSRQCFDLQKKVIDFQSLMLLVLKNPVVNGIVNKNISQEDKKELYKMLLEGTKIQILKQETIKEMVEDEKSFWRKIKDKLGIR